MNTRQTKRRKERFIAAIARGLSSVAAAEHAGIDRTTPYKWESTDPMFAQAIAEARETRLKQLLDTAFDQAMEGEVPLIRYLIDRYDREATRQTAAPITEIEISVREVDHDQPDRDTPGPPAFFEVETTG